MIGSPVSSRADRRASIAVQFAPAAGAIWLSVTVQGPTVVCSPGASAARRSLVKALSLAMPNSAMARPKWPNTMPQVAIGTRRRLRPRSGMTLAKASIAASASPSRGRKATSPISDTRTRAATRTAPISASSRRIRPNPSLRQRRSGPTAITATIGSAKIAPTGLK